MTPWSSHIPPKLRIILTYYLRLFDFTDQKNKLANFVLSRLKTTVNIILSNERHLTLKIVELFQLKDSFFKLPTQRRKKMLVGSFIMQEWGWHIWHLMINLDLSKSETHNVIPKGVHSTSYEGFFTTKLNLSLSFRYLSLTINL